MKANLEAIIKQYENRKCFQSDFLIESKARKAYSGEEEPLKRLIEHLENNYPEQLDFISNLKEYLPAESAIETNNELELKPIQEEIQMSILAPSMETKNESELTDEEIKKLVSELVDEEAGKPLSAPETTEEQVGDNDTSSPVRQYQPGMEYLIEPDEEVDIHPAAKTMPMMSSAELWGLVNDIKHGKQSFPILTWNGAVVDGRNRLEACRKLGIVTKANEIPANTDISKLVVSLNEHRRHLKTSQKAACAALYMEETKVSGGRSRDIVGKTFKVSGTYVQKAKKIKDVNEELFLKLHRGEVTLEAAMKEIKKDDHPNTENYSGYSDDEACAELSKYFIKDKVDELSDLADKCSGNLRVVLKTLLKYICGEITTQKTIPMLQYNNDSGSTLDCELGVAK